jgi:hypothetical protein
VEVEEHYRQARTEFRQHFAERQRAGGTGPPARTFDEAAANYRMGFAAGYDERYAGRDFEQVEPELRRDYEASRGHTATDRWEEVREEIREGFTRARQR